MIFGSLALLMTSAVLMAFGVGRSSVPFLVLSLLAACAAGLMLLAAYATHRRSLSPAGTSPSGGGTSPMVAAPTWPQGTQPVMMYVPVASPGNGSPPPVVGYDDMTAEQIVALLGSGALTDVQLRAIHDYEAAGRGRATVLSRVERLLQPAH